MRLTQTRTHGFTLIEVMIAVAIVAILASIAIPSYQSSLARSEIRSAQADILALSLAFNSRYQRTLAYPILAAPAAEAAITPVFNEWKKSTSKFAFVVTASSATDYTIRATGSGLVAGCWVQLTRDNTRTAGGCRYITGAWL